MGGRNILQKLLDLGHIQHHFVSSQGIGQALALDLLGIFNDRILEKHNARHGQKEHTDDDAEACNQAGADFELFQHAVIPESVVRLD